MEDAGVIRLNPYNSEEWSYRFDCFAVPGGDDYIPLVNERFRPDQPDVFREFLACDDRDAAAAAALKVAGTSAFLRSVGKDFRAQVRALRWRSVVNALMAEGWKVVRMCLEHGLLADYVFRDPVFETVEHYCVLHDVARRIVQDDVPWRRAAARRRLREFFPGDLFHAVAHVLTASSDHDLQLFLWDRLFPSQFVSAPGRCALVVAFWRHRRDRFDELCRTIGLPRSNAVYEVFHAGFRDALPDVLAVEDTRTRKAAFIHAWNAGDRESATALAKSLAPADREFAVPGLTLAVASCLRLAELEAMVTSLLLERMRVSNP